MQEIQIRFKFLIGDTVKDISTGREGTVRQRFSKITKLNEEKYLAILSYTVKPEKTYNQFRVEEGSLIEIEYDDMGERIS